VTVGAERYHDPRLIRLVDIYQVRRIMNMMSSTQCRNRVLPGIEHAVVAVVVGTHRVGGDEAL